MPKGAYRGANGNVRKTKPKSRPTKPSPRMQAVLDGELSIEDLTYEELARGQLMDKNGSFQGRPSDFIPRQFYDAAQAELVRRWEQKVAEELEPALNTLKEIINNPKAPADARYKSAVYLIERKVGKVPEKNDIKVQVAPWQKGIEGVLVDVPEEKAG